MVTLSCCLFSCKSCPCRRQRSQLGSNVTFQRLQPEAPPVTMATTSEHPALTTMSFIAPVVTVVVAIAHQLLRDADPRRAQEVIFPATHRCPPVKEQRLQLKQLSFLCGTRGRVPVGVLTRFPFYLSRCVTHGGREACRPSRGRQSGRRQR